MRVGAAKELAMTRLPSLAFVVFLAACGASAGFQQAAPRVSVSTEPVINDDQVQRAFALQAQLPKPYRLGVLFRDTAPSPDHEREWRWEPEHRAQLMKALEALEGKGEIGTVVSIARAAVVGDDLHAIRVAAARQGLDAVLVVTGDDKIERDVNGWATTYLAVLPLLFAPGNELRVDFTTHAELWDVRNEYLYLAAEAEARAEQARATPYIDVEEASAKAQNESLGLLVHELEKRFAKLHGA
jgi:hypothetical protein